MLCVEQLPDDPATLKRMLVEQDAQLELIHARHEAEKEAAIRASRRGRDSSRRGRGGSSGRRQGHQGDDGLVLAALLRPAERTLRSAATLVVRPEDRRDAAGRGEHRRGIARRTCHSPRGEAAQARPPPAAGPSAADRHRARSRRCRRSRARPAANCASGSARR